MRGEQSHVHR